MTDELKQALKDLNEAAYKAQRMNGADGSQEFDLWAQNKLRLATIARWTDELVDEI